MENSIENPNYKVVYGVMFTNENEKIEMPPKNANTIGASAIILNGEMDIDVVGHTAIKDENGKTVARVDNKYPKVLLSKGLDEKTAVEAVSKYMNEKGYKSINEIADESKIENIEEYKKKKSTKNKIAAGDEGR